MQGFGEGLGEAVRKSRGHDRRIVVAGRLEGLGAFLLAVAGGHRETADPVRLGPHRRDEVGQSHVRPTAVRLGRGFDDLLAKCVQAGQLGRPGFVGVQDDVVAVGIGRPEADHALGGEPLLADDPLQHGLGVGEQVRRRLAHNVVGQDLRIAADQLPAGEERRPVDVSRQVGQVPGLERSCADEAGSRRVIGRPVGGEGVVARLIEGRTGALVLTAGEGLAHLDVFGRRLGLQPVLFRRREQARDHAHRPAGVEHIGGLTALVARLDLHRRVGLRRGRPADQQRDRKAAPLHFGGHIGHLIETGSDQARQPHDVDLVRDGLVKDAVGRDHDAQVDDLIVVALQDHADDVFADVVDVALDGSHEDAAGVLARLARLLGFHEGHKVGDRLLHHPGGLHHLRQEHFPGAEQVADHVHAVHQRAFDDVQRALGGGPRLLGVGLDPVGDAIDQGVGDARAHRAFAPGQVRALGLGLAALVLRRQLDQAFGIGQAGVALSPIEDHILDRLAQLGRDVVIDRQLAGVDDAHVHAGGDGVKQEHRVDRPAHGLIAAETERHVRDPA